MLDNFISPPPRRRPSTSQEKPPIKTNVAPQQAEPLLKKQQVANEEPIVLNSLEHSKEFNVKTGEDKAEKRKKILLISLIVGVILAIIAGAIYWFVFREPTVKQVNTTTGEVEEVNVEEKEKYVSPLTGMEVADEQTTKKQITGIMIENSPESRPQSGLDKAGVVYEAIAEGGVTRFLALFQESEPDYIGPVRSARPYYVEWAYAFDASYAHVGGSPEGLARIKELGVKDLDQFYNSSSYWRESSRYAPHNVYTSSARMAELNTKKGFTSSTFNAWQRKIDVAQTPTANTIDFSVSGPTYSPRFVYDAATNSYKRFQSNKPHNVLAKDKKTTTQITPKVIIALVLKQGLKDDGYHTDYITTGSGKMFVFQDGIVSVGTWSRTIDKANYTFTDKYGLPMKLNAGQTWVTAVGAEGAVNYKP
jgi:Protein of unknown function (DUF3048) N-terminal domain/Protein of unknown function (DUF3048) C-terminal domain